MEVVEGETVDCANHYRVRYCNIGAPAQNTKLIANVSIHIIMLPQQAIMYEAIYMQTSNKS